MSYHCPLPENTKKELFVLLKTILQHPNSLTTILSSGEKIKNPGTGIHGEYIWSLHWRSIEVRTPNKDLLFKCSHQLFEDIKVFAPPTHMSLAMGPYINFTDITPRQVATMLLGASILIPNYIDSLTVKKNIVEQSVALLDFYRIEFEKENLNALTPNMAHRVNSVSSKMSLKI